MAQNDLRIEIEILRRELQQLEQRGRQWHSSKGLHLFVGGATAFLVICSIFGLDIGLGPTGQAITFMAALACFLHYWQREKSSLIDTQRERQLRETIDRYSVELGLRVK